jgi:Mce-associated membrane protein
LAVAADDKSDTETTETDLEDTAEADAAESELIEDTEPSEETATAEAFLKETRATETSRGRKALLGGLVAVLLVGALAAAGFFGWKWWDLKSTADAGRAAQEAAVAYAQVLTSIDSTKVDENFNQVLDGATGEFKDMYSQSSVQLRQLLIDNKATAHGVVVESAVQSASRDKVVVLLFVDQSVSNTNVPDPRIDRSRIKMTMEDVDGRWRASKVELP